MKRVLLASAALLCSSLSFSQLQQDFDPAPTGWTLSQGANFQQILANGSVVTPSNNGNNPSQAGTPVLYKTSGTF
jgi:hypothetical protein